MKSFINFRTAILCSVCCLCSLPVNAQDILVDFQGIATEGTTGFSLRNGNDGEGYNDDPDLFAITLNEDGISNSNVLIDPIVVDVPEAGDAGLQLTLNATATTGNDSTFDNRIELRVSGLGLGLRGQPLRSIPDLDANAGMGTGVPSSTFRLDGIMDEFVFLSFNQDVTISAIGLSNLDDGEVFEFGPATNITNLNDLTLPDLTMGTIPADATTAGFSLFTFTFETPLQIPAGEEIRVGQTGFDPDTLSGANAGVGFEQITLTIDGDGGLDDGHGDVNLDGIVNFLDIAPFINVLSSGGSPAEESQADCSGDGVVSFLDISPFIQALAAAAS